MEAPPPSHPLLSHPSPCFTPQNRAPLGFLVFTGITIFSLAFVIFLTSVQTLSGLRQSCRFCPKLPCRIGLRRSGAAATPASAHSASPHRELGPPRARIPFKLVSSCAVRLRGRGESRQ